MTDRANTRVWLGDTAVRVEYVGDPDSAGLRQVNAAVPEKVQSGDLLVECAGVTSDGYPVRIV